MPRNTDRLFTILIGLLSAVLVYAVSGTLTQHVVVAGEKAPDFKVITDNGRTITRSDFGGKVLVLNFWATWCQPCIEEIPSLDEFQRKMAPQGVVVLGISVDRKEDSYKRFMDRARVSFLTASDPEGNVGADYGTFKYPETYIINSKGEVLEKFIGPENWTDPRIVDRIRKLL
jgi:cytochrome c biogenesis protein CcmG, thiol:disulfide interchange protein DsbE